MDVLHQVRAARRRGPTVAAGWVCCLVAASLAGCAAQDPDSPGPTASAQAQAVADSYAARANAAADAGRALQQAVADAQLSSQRAPGGFVTQPLYSSGDGSSGPVQQTVAVLNDRGVCYSFTLTLGPTHVTSSQVSVMDACPPSSS